MQPADDDSETILEACSLGLVDCIRHPLLSSVSSFTGTRLPMVDRGTICEEPQGRQRFH